MLRIVHPAREGQGTDPPARRPRSRAASLFLTGEECQRFRASLRNIARAYGGYAVLAQVMSVPVKTLYKAANRRSRPAGILAIRLAKAGGTTVEAVIGGQLEDSGRCKACGARVASSKAGAA